MTFSNLTHEEWFSLNSHKFDSETYNRIKSMLQFSEKREEIESLESEIGELETCLDYKNDCVAELEQLVEELQDCCKRHETTIEQLEQMLKELK